GAEDLGHLGAEQQVGDDRRDASHGGYWARMLWNSRFTESGRPHQWLTSTRPSRTPRTASSPAVPSSSSRLKVPCTGSAAAAWPKRCATLMRQCQPSGWREWFCALVWTRCTAAST